MFQNNNLDDDKLVRFYESCRIDLLKWNAKSNILSFDNKVIFYLKFQCELNPVEGVFCDLKHNVTKHKDQYINKINTRFLRNYKNILLCGQVKG